MFPALKNILFTFCILKPCIGTLRISDLKDCKEDGHESKICLTDKNGYFKPFPLIIYSDLVLRKLIEIDKNKNSITAQFELTTSWSDPGISLSNISSV